jgi:hypothetical protein
MKKVVTDFNLGYQVKYNTEKQKLEVNIDGSTLTTDDAGVISVDTAALGIKVVSDDDGNVISVGSDKGAMLKADDIKVIVGQMVADNTDGVDYDELSKTLRAYLTDLQFDSSTTIQFGVTEDADFDGKEGDFLVTAAVKISAEAGNALEAKDDGLFIAAVADTTNTLEVDKTTDAEKLKSTVDGVEASVDLERVEDLSGNILYYAFKA